MLKRDEVHRQRLYADITKDSCFFENLVANQGSPRYPDHRKVMVGAAILLQALDLVCER